MSESAISRSPPSAIPRVCAADLTPVAFVERFVQQNQPVIVDEALTEWTQQLRKQQANEASPADKQAEWSISELTRLLGDTRVANVFVASAEHKRRFKYFKQAAGDNAAASAQAASTAASPSTAAAASLPDTGLQRRSMPFSQFVQLSLSSEQPDASVNGGATSSYYLYGEPMPSALQSYFPTPPILSHVSSPLTSVLLWASLSATVSPLHYDLNEGILCQLAGVKRVLLVAPPHHASLYPYPLVHPHDRQSSVDDIRCPDSSRFPQADSLPLMEGNLTPGSLLYIPYGWWHQLEATGASVSVSMRWNPYEDALRQAATAAQAVSMLPAPARRAVLARVIHQSSLPSVVADINQRRWEELAQQHKGASTEDLLAAAT